MDIKANLIHCKAKRTHELKSFTTVTGSARDRQRGECPIVAAPVLTGVFGIKHFANITHADHESPSCRRVRMFESFDTAFAKAALSRLFSGIHFWFDCDGKLTVGQWISQAISGRPSFKDNDRHRQVKRFVPSSIMWVSSVPTAHTTS